MENRTPVTWGGSPWMLSIGSARPLSLTAGLLCLPQTPLRVAGTGRARGAGVPSHGSLDVPYLLSSMCPSAATQRLHAGPDRAELVGGRDGGGTSQRRGGDKASRREERGREGRAHSLFTWAFPLFPPLMNWGDCDKGRRRRQSVRAANAVRLRECSKRHRSPRASRKSRER